MNQTAKTFLALGLVLILSAGSIGISKYVQNEPERKLIKEGKLNPSAKRGNTMPEGHSEITNFITQLEEDLNQDPDNLDKKLELANAYFQEGVGMGEALFLKRAAGLYNEISEKDETKTDALLGLATLSLHVGVFDKAQEFYEKYLKQVPEDLAARVNLALALGRGGKLSEGLKEVDKVLKKNSKFVIGLVTKGLLVKESGNEKDALELFNKAYSLEENPQLKERIDELRATKTASPSNKSPIEQLKSYFTNHPILKNKFVSIEDNNGSVLVKLDQFPVEAMPPFAKEKLSNNIKALLKETGHSELTLLDSETQNELMKIEANR